MKDVLYFAPQKMNEALKLLAKHRGKITILAGGTDLVPKMNYHVLKPEMLLYVGGLGLDYIKKKDGKVVIGTATPWSKVASSSVIARMAPALAEAAQQSSCVAIKSTATVGGNLGSASPAADLATPLLVMDAQLRLASARKSRVVALKDFFKGPGETVRKSDELITEVHVPLLKGKSVFLKVGRRKAMTLSVVNVAVRLEMAGKTCKDARIALGSMAPTPIRCSKAEGLLKGKAIDKDLISRCAAEAVAESNPIDDGRATAWYRKKAGTALVFRALGQVAGIQT
jgi:carbon-monoxide dehydrogenase medium subunit